MFLGSRDPYFRKQIRVFIEHLEPLDQQLPAAIQSSDTTHHPWERICP